jgi:hypothetical protein
LVVMGCHSFHHAHLFEVGLKNFFTILHNVMRFSHAGFHVICMTDVCTYYSWNAWFKRMLKSYVWHEW